MIWIGIIIGFVLAIAGCVALYFAQFNWQKYSKEEYDAGYDVLSDALQIRGSTIQAWHGDHLLSEFTFENN